MSESPNKTKHTPGPWIFDGAVEDDYLVSAQVWPEESASYIAPIATVDGDWAASEANARLIAAAPELLEALQSMLNWMREAEEETGKPIGVGYRANMHKPVIIEKVRSAIARAAGREVSRA